jgi:hypothetical protein
MMRLFPPFFFPAIIAGSAVGMMVFALLRREWRSAGGYACILLMATEAARTWSEPANTLRDNAHRALRTAGLAAGLGTLMGAASFGIPSNRGASPVSVMLVAVAGGAVFGGGGYLVIMALGAAWDAAVAGIKRRLRGHR